ncbi:YcxB family protein [Aliirhizobium terrae]|uniref:YcxB family protein n=1 Tax=Terrirhizobium terrae TaxID=2926709 RepID=UPI0025788694|nr:YcxB family protein [Rhizobium sp. CC-CFT758]WJH39257.1 YcxB family protein [Rhizobium sp. CC-CFT758]
MGQGRGPAQAGKYRRYLTRLGETGQRAVSFRFDGEGITLIEADGMAQLQPWHDNLTLTDENGWLCFVGHMHELCITIPKYDLSAQQIEAILEWNELRTAAGLPANLAIAPELQGAEIARSETFTSSRDELVATVEETGNSQAWRMHRIRTFLAIAAALSLLTPAFYLIGWLIDPDRLPLAIAWPIYLELFMTTFWKTALVAVAVMAGFAAFNSTFRRWGARFYADQMLAAGLGESTVVIGENGLLDDGTAIRMFIPWKAIRRVRISPDHIFLTIRLGAVLTYPKRVFPSDKIPAIETLFRERVGQGVSEGKNP